MALRTTDSLLAIYQRWVDVALSEQPWGDASNPDPSVDTDPRARNSIADAEQLECFLLPQFSLKRFDLSEFGRVGSPEVRVSDDRLATILSKLNPQTEKEGAELDPQALDETAAKIADFLERNSVDGQPTFGAGSYLSPSDDGDRSAEARTVPPVVDAYTMSLSVTLQASHLMDRWLTHPDVKRKSQKSLQEQLLAVRLGCGTRLTAAMLGLSRSFASNAVPDWQDAVERAFPNTTAIRDIRRRLRPDDRPYTPFECGWSWGITPPNLVGWEPENDYEKIEGEAGLEARSALARAEPAPYLYFTVTAMEGIADLMSPKVRGSDLINRGQAFLQSRLGFYMETTALYWAELVFEDLGGRWAIEELPWSTSDGSWSDYWSLYLLLIATSSPAITSRFADESAIERLLLVLEELAQRARLTRNPYPRNDDPAVRLHAPPGQALPLLLASGNGGEGPVPSGYEWWIYDFGPKLLKLAGRVYGLARQRRLRERARELVDAIWDDHLALRRYDSTVMSYAWDDVHRVFEQLDEPPRRDGYKMGSWYITERVVEGLVAVAHAEGQRTLTPDVSRELALEMLEELRWLTANEVKTEEATASQLSKAEELLDQYPAAAIGILTKVAEQVAEPLSAED